MAGSVWSVDDHDDLAALPVTADIATGLAYPGDICFVGLSGSLYIHTWVLVDNVVKPVDNAHVVTPSTNPGNYWWKNIPAGMPPGIWVRAYIDGSLNDYYNLESNHPDIVTSQLSVRRADS